MSNTTDTLTPLPTLRADFAVIADWIQPQARVLDLGCGDGSLLEYLARHKGVQGIGVDIGQENFQRCLDKGIDVIQTDLENGLKGFEDCAFDYVVLSQTLQAIRNTEIMVNELLRVGREAVVTFPNFGYWRVRWQLFARGRMPVSEELPYQWYDTPNVHLFTIRDFDRFCAERNIHVLQRHMLAQGRLVGWGANLRSVLAIYRMRRN